MSQESKALPTPGPASGRRKVGVVFVESSRCPSCGSTERSGYSHARERVVRSGVDRWGRPATHVVWRRTTCKTCGAVRDDRMFENRITGAGDGGR